MRLARTFIAMMVTVMVVGMTTAAAFAGGLNLAKQGLAAQHEGDWPKAIDLYSQALAAGDLTSESKAFVLGLRANAYGATGAFDKSMADFAVAMDAVPGESAPYVGRSIVYRQMGDYAHAIEDASTAIAHSPAYTLAYTNRGLANFYAGNFAAAAEDFTHSQKDDPTEPDFVLWLHLSRPRRSAGCGRAGG